MISKNQILRKQTQFKPNSNPNKPNYKKAKMNVNKVLTKEYENKRFCRRAENKPKQTQSHRFYLKAVGFSPEGMKKDGSFDSQNCRKSLSIKGMRAIGFEPTRPKGHQDLNILDTPVSRFLIPLTGARLPNTPIYYHTSEFIFTGFSPEG